MVEITDGDAYFYRGHFFYDLVKTTVIRMAFALSQDLKECGIVGRPQESPSRSMGDSLGRMMSQPSDVALSQSSVRLAFDRLFLMHERRSLDGWQKLVAGGGFPGGIVQTRRGVVEHGWLM